MEEDRKDGYYWIRVEHCDWEIVKLENGFWFEPGNPAPINPFLVEIGDPVLPRTYDKFILDLVKQASDKQNHDIKTATVRFTRMLTGAKISLWIAAVVGIVSIILSIIKTIRCR